MASTLTPEQIEELRRLEREATPGPWRDRIHTNTSSRFAGEAIAVHVLAGEGSGKAIEPFAGQNTVLSRALSKDDIANQEHTRNARLVVASRNALPVLLDHCAALEKALAEERERRERAEQELARLKARKFPVLMGADSQKLRALGCPASVPWDFIADNARQCEHNHSQTPEQLAERGGLGPDEMCAVVEGRRWRKMTDEECCRRLRELLAEYGPPPSQPSPTGEGSG